MSDRFEESVDEGFKIVEAEAIIHSEDRRKVVVEASRMIDAMTDKGAGVHREQTPTGAAAEFATAPGSVPAMGWESFHSAPDDGEPYRFQILGNIGEYYSHIFSNKCPAATFNTGFYAGVLAAKLGLVEVDQYHMDTERPQPSPDTSTG